MHDVHTTLHKISCIGSEVLKGADTRMAQDQGERETLWYFKPVIPYEVRKSPKYAQFTIGAHQFDLSLQKSHYHQVFWFLWATYGFLAVVWLYLTYILLSGINMSHTLV